MARANPLGRKGRVGMFKWSFYFLLVSSVVVGQNPKKIDSLRFGYRIANHDTDKIRAFFKWAEEIYISSPDSSMLLTQLNINLIEKAISGGGYSETQVMLLNIKLAQARANMAYFNHVRGDVQSALDMYLKCVETYKSYSAASKIKV